MKMTRKAIEHVLYSNNDWYDRDEYGKTREDYAIEYLMDVNGYGSKDEVTNDELYRYMEDEAAESWSMLKGFLEDAFSDYGRLIAKGACGCWNGTFDGGKIVTTVDELLCAFHDCDYITVVDNGGRLEVTGIHHDGSVFMEVKGITPYGEEWLARNEYMEWNDPAACHTELMLDRRKAKDLHIGKKYYNLKEFRMERVKEEPLKRSTVEPVKVGVNLHVAPGAKALPSHAKEAASCTL